jgi:hypothetical protein
MNSGTRNAILTRIWWRYKIHHANWSWRNSSIDRRSTHCWSCLDGLYSVKTIQDQLCLYPKTIDSKCWREVILDWLWRTWRCAEKQEPCSRLVTYESDQASGVRTLIASSCQWYDFKCSRLLKIKVKTYQRFQQESKCVWSAFYWSGRIGDFGISTCYENNWLFG